MGDIAEMMLDGTLDAITGEYIDGHSTGYPRTIDGSLPWESGNRGYRGNQSAISGVTKWLGKRGIKKRDKVRAVVHEYATKELGHPETIKNETACKHISSDFGKFIDWYNRNK